MVLNRKIVIATMQIFSKFFSGKCTQTVILINTVFISFSYTIGLRSVTAPATNIKIIKGKTVTTDMKLKKNIDTKFFNVSAL